MHPYTLAKHRRARRKVAHARGSANCRPHEITDFGTFGIHPPAPLSGFLSRKPDQQYLTQLLQKRHDDGVQHCAECRLGFSRPSLFLLWRSNDKPVVRSLLDALNDYDVLIAHNGLKCDLVFIRTRLAKWNLKPLPEKKLIDPVQIARNKLRMSGSSLDKLASFIDASFLSQLHVMGITYALGRDKKLKSFKSFFDVFSGMANGIAAEQRRNIAHGASRG